MRDTWSWTSDFWIHFIFTFFAFTVGNRAISALPLYLVLVGGRVELPCVLNVSTSEDEVSLVLWHKDESSSPLYSVDARDTPLRQAKHFHSNDVANRAYFNSTVAPAVLRIEGVKKSEEGMYRCRVEYRRARTEMTDLMLKVIIPPREAIIMDEFGQRLRGLVGPLNEGQSLALACEGEGGDPTPTVQWWRGNELLDDSYGLTAQGFARNELVLTTLERSDLMTTLVCQVSNSNLTSPVISSVTLDMNLVPTSVRITSMYRPLSSGQEAELVCIAKGARPPAQVSWWIEKEQIKQRVTESSSREDNLTVSTLSLIPKSVNDHKNLTCRADNPQIPSVVLEDIWHLNIHYLPKVRTFIHPPNPVVEGDIVNVICHVVANPPISELEWLLDGKVVEKTKLNFQWDHRTNSNRTLNIPSVGAQNKGLYQCAAISSEGRSVSEPTMLRVHYSPKCESVRSSVYGVGKTESVSVVCEVDAEPADVTFFWMLNNSEVAAALPASQYRNNGTRRSVATIAPKTPEDYGVLYCWAKNAIGKQREPCSFRIVQAGPPEEPRNCRIYNTTQNCAVLECDAGKDDGLQLRFQLEVFSVESKTYLANISVQKEPVFSLCHLPLKRELVFVLYAANSRGRSRDVTIRTRTQGDGTDGSKSKVEFGIITGVLIGVIGVLVLLAISAIVVTKYRRRRVDKDQDCSPETDKSGSRLMKDFKDQSVTSSQGPDIIPEKGFFREETDFSSPSQEKDISCKTGTSDSDSRKYFEYPTMSYTESKEYLSTPKKLRLLQDTEMEVEDNGITVETPLIATIPLVAQQWTDHHRKEGLRLSTPV